MDAAQARERATAALREGIRFVNKHISGGVAAKVTRLPREVVNRLMGGAPSTPTTPSFATASSRTREWKQEDEGAFHAAEYATLEPLLAGLKSEQVQREFSRIPEEDYTNTEEIRIWVGTYNVNGRSPPKDVELSQLVNTWSSNWPDRDGPEVHEGADIYVVGFQEVVPLNAQNIAGVWSESNAVAWDKAINKALNPWKREEPESSSEPEVEKPEKSADVVDMLSGWSGGRATPGSHAPSLARSHRSFTESSNSHQEVVFKSSLSMTHKRDVSEEQAEIETGACEAADLSKGEDNFINENEPFKEEEVVQVVSKQLVGLYLTVWVRRRLLPFVSGVQTTYVATGALGYLANKGAIAARMRINDSSLVFVTSHFASGDHVGDEARRNVDFSEIMRRAEFPYERSIKVDGTMEGLPSCAPPDVVRTHLGGFWGASRKLQNHENLIWLGDLNYRIQGLSKAVVQIIRADRIHRLYEHDELQREHNEGRVFHGFKEGPITFPPTYKYRRGSNLYTGELSDDSGSSSDTDDYSELKSESTNDETEGNLQRRNSLSSLKTHNESRPGRPSLGASASERTMRTTDVLASKAMSSVSKAKKKTKKPMKIRTPSWTDRILYYTSGRLHHLMYGSCQEMLMSDHKPVCSTFLLQSKVFDREAVVEHIDKCWRVVDEREMASIPRCQIEPTEFGLGILKYKEPMTCSLRIANVGEVPAMFGFIPPPEPALDRFAHQLRPLPQWITATPAAGEVQPGESFDIEFTAHVTGGKWGSANELAMQLILNDLWEPSALRQSNTQAGAPEGRVEEIIVLRIEGGRDFFISMSAVYVSSSFGISLDSLAAKKPAKDPKRSLKTHRVELESMKYRSSSDPLDLVQKLESVDEDKPDAQVQSVPSLRTGVLPNLVEGPIGEMIPSELSRMLHFLCEKDRLKTPYIFMKELRELKDDDACGRFDMGTADIRRILDLGNSFPLRITPSQMARALLSFFRDLPTPLIPDSIAKAVDVSKLSEARVASLTKEAMSAIEWSVMRTTLEVFRTALTPLFSQANKLTISSAAVVLAELCFRPVDQEPGISYSLRQKKNMMDTNAHVQARQAAYMEYILMTPWASPEEAGHK